MKIQITENALYQRIKRKLSKDGEQFCRVNPNHSDSIDKYGRYYVVTNDGVVKRRVDIVKLASNIGVMKPYEELTQ